jgi:ribonucleoside-diphosphate reductase alpha chain
LSSVISGRESKSNGTSKVLAEREAAIIQGYTGDSCSECGSFQMVRNGSCLKCNSCGTTTGCS